MTPKILSVNVSFPEEIGFDGQKVITGPYIEMSNGMFGENFTIGGLNESEVSVGDAFQIGSSKVSATQPRMPCYKPGIKFGRMDVIKKISR